MDKNHEDDMTDELRAKDRQEQINRALRWAHPDCRDPDHPGCAKCEEKEEEEEEVTLHEYLLNDDTLYCNYCLTPQGDKYHCCQENHFSKYADLYPDEQESIREEYDE